MSKSEGSLQFIGDGHGMTLYATVKVDIVVAELKNLTIWNAGIPETKWFN